LLEAAYMLAVAGLGASGFVTGTTALILAATVLALPTGVVALVGYYLVYGLLALVPGANPDTNQGFSCSAATLCPGDETGELASWFVLSGVVIGVLLLTVAAACNVALLRFARRAR
jgi:hypothetical protein